MAWKKIILEGEAAILSDTAPVDIDTAVAGAGIATDASRRDHKHDVGDMTGMTADTIAEKTGAAGVTVDGVLLKDSKLLGTVTIPAVTDTLATLGQIETFSGVKTFSATPLTDAIAELTPTAGVTIDTCLIKDGKVADSNLLEGSSKATVQDHTPKAHTLAAHTTPAGPVDCGQQQLDGLVPESAASAPDIGTEVAGQLYYNTTDKHVYQWVPA